MQDASRAEIKEPECHDATACLTTHINITPLNLDTQMHTFFGLDAETQNNLRDCNLSRIQNSLSNIIPIELYVNIEQAIYARSLFSCASQNRFDNKVPFDYSICLRHIYIISNIRLEAPFYSECVVG